MENIFNKTIKCSNCNKEYYIANSQNEMIATPISEKVYDYQAINENNIQKIQTVCPNCNYVNKTNLENFSN